MSRPDSRVISMGVHVLDVLVRPVSSIPEGQEGALVDEIKISAAGTAGATAVDLAKLGATVSSAGAIGTDATGDMLVQLLARNGVDTSLLLRRSDLATSASVLPIRPDGSRPAFHVIGANASYTHEDAPWEAIAASTHLHLGGPEFMGGESAAKVLSFARSHGLTTSIDILASGGVLDWIAPCLPYVDHLLPNAEQVVALTGADDLIAGARVLLDLGVGSVAATAGGDGVVLVDADGVTTVPAFEVDVVDTSGCGDAFSAGFIRGLGLGRSVPDAAVLGCATAGVVAGGLGSDHGSYDLDRLETFIRDTPTRPQEQL
jgi:sugar/nucleoside kinase (ribokinase family)